MTFQILKTINSRTLTYWDVRRLLFSFSSKTVFPLVPLGQILTPRKEKIKKKDFEGSFPVVAKISFDDGKIHLRQKRQTGMDLFKVYDGDLLISNINFHQGASAINSLGTIVCSTHYQPYQLNSKLNSTFMSVLLRSNQFKHYLTMQKANGIKTETKFNFLKTLLIPLPSLTQQKKIITKYIQLIQKAQNIEQQEVNLNHQIELYMIQKLDLNQSVLFDSKWFYLINYKDLGRWDVKGVQSSNLVLKSQKYSNVPLTDCYLVNPKTRFPVSPETKISFIPMASISEFDGKIIVKQERPAIEATGYTKMQEGDLLWAKITPCMENGKSAIASFLKNGVAFGSTEFHVLRKKQGNQIKTEFVHCLLRLPRVLQVATHFFTGSSGQQRVPASFLKELVIPVPPRSIQQEIVEEVENMQNNAKKLHTEAILLRKKAQDQFERDVFNA